MSVQPAGVGLDRDTFLADVSPASSYFSLYKQRMDEPTVETATWEYSRQSVDYIDLPETERIDQAISNLSIRARHAFQQWTSELGYQETRYSADGQIIFANLKLDDPRKLLTEEEYCLYKEYEEEVNREKLEFQAECDLAARRAEEESFGFKYRESSDLVHPKFKINNLGKKYDLCQGKYTIKHIRGVSAGIDEKTTYSISHSEFVELIRRSNFETTIIRTAHQGNNYENCYPNVGIKDDPDFIPPSETSTLFNSNTPSYRQYNITFQLKYKIGNRIVTKKLLPDTKNGKDYTSKSSMIYLLQQKGYKDFELTEISSSTEVDIRVTFGKVPDPVNYRKVDPRSNYGLSFMRLLHGSANSSVELKEYSFETEQETVVEDRLGRPRKINEKVTKICLYCNVAVKYKRKNQIATFWTYLDQSKVGTLRSVLRNKKTGPQIEDIYIVSKDRRKVLIGHKLRLSLSFVSRTSNQEYLSYAEILHIYKSTKFKDFKLVKIESESFINDVHIHYFIHKDYLTPESRLKALQ